MKTTFWTKSWGHLPSPQVTSLLKCCSKVAWRKRIAPYSRYKTSSYGISGAAYTTDKNGPPMAQFPQVAWTSMRSWTVCWPPGITFSSRLRRPVSPHEPALPGLPLAQGPASSCCPTRWPFHQRLPRHRCLPQGQGPILPAVTDRIRSGMIRNLGYFTCSS